MLLLGYGKFSAFLQTSSCPSHFHVGQGLFHLISRQEKAVTGDPSLLVEQPKRMRGFLLSGGRGTKVPSSGPCQLHPQTVFSFPYHHTIMLITKIMKIVELIRCIYEIVMVLLWGFCLGFFGLVIKTCRNSECLSGYWHSQKQDKILGDSLLSGTGGSNSCQCRPEKA